MTHTRTEILLLFSDKLQQAQQGCEDAIEQQDHDNIFACIEAYRNCLITDLQRNFLQAPGEEAQYNPNHAEIHPEALLQFEQQVGEHIDKLCAHQRTYCTWLGIHEQENAQAALAATRQELNEMLQRFKERSNINNAVLSDDELQSRLYWKIARYSGKATVLIGGCAISILAPPLLLGSQAMWWTVVGTYATVGSTTSGLQAISYNAIDQEDVTTGLWQSMLAGGVFGGISGGIASYWGAAAKQAGKATSETLQLKATVTKKALAQKGGKMITYKATKVSADASATSSATAATSQTFGLETTLTSVAHISRQSTDDNNGFDEGWQTFLKIIESHQTQQQNRQMAGSSNLFKQATTIPTHVTTHTAGT